MRASLEKLDEKIDRAVTTLRGEISAMAAKAASDLKDLATRIDGQLSEMRAEQRSMRNAIDQTNIRLDQTNARLSVANEKLTSLDTKLNALFWVIGGSITLGTFVITVGKAFGWF